MADRIKGITIEFRGDTSSLDRALKDVRSESRSLDNDLRAVDKALKFDPKNTELLAQKQQLLRSRVQSTTDRLNVLRQAQAKLDDDPAVDKTSQDYMRLRRQIIESESELRRFEAELKKLDNIKLTQLGNQIKSLGSKATSAGKTMTTSLTVPIAGAFALSANLASDYEENLNKIDVAFGSSSKEVTNWANNARDKFGLSKVAATGAVSAFGALGKGIGLAEGDAAKMSTTLAGLSADLASYFNTGTDESAKALEGIFTGESEALKRFGVVMTDTNLEKFAADQGLVWKEMDQTEKTMLRYQYVLAKTKDAQGDYSRTSDGTANSIKTFKAAIEDLGTAIGTNLLPIITPIVQRLTEWIQKFADLDPAAQKVITVVGIVVAALGPLLTVFGMMATGVGAIITALPILGGAFTALLGPVGVVVAAVAAAIAIGVALYKNWDKIKKAAGTLKDFVINKFRALRSGVKSVFTAIKDAMLAPVRSAVDKIKSMIAKIKDFFNFRVHLPKIKLPHFYIDPPGWHLGDLLQGEIPTLGIDWYAKGAIFTKPTIIGNKGFGEAGAEAALPLDVLWTQMNGMFTNMADDIVNGVSMAMQMHAAGAGGNITIPIYLFPSGPKMGEQVVKTYDLYKKKLG